MTDLLKAASSHPQLRDLPRTVVTDALRETVDDIRARITDGRAAADSCDVQNVLVQSVARVQSNRASRLRGVINATGIVLHTNLGRSVLAEAAAERVALVARNYSNLEIELDTGQRGRRGAYAEALLRKLTGAEAAMIVNNNAAATMLVLRGLAQGRETIVSRGQLVEIGGSYRLPEVMAAGGVRLREVGTTNKTRLSDYESALSPDTALIMHVHTSNYRIVGFTDSPGTGELAGLAHAHNLPMLDDLGSGALLDHPLWAAAAEPTVTKSLRDGADVVTFSGDKLLGGPQAGILLGRRDIIDRLRKDPMTRALRVDKMTLAALEATLELYQSPDTVMQAIPTLSRLSEPIESLRQRAVTLAARLAEALPGEAFEVTTEESFAGGGSLPAWPLPTAVVRWKPSGRRSVSTVSERLRVSDPAVLVRVQDDAILIDVRTVSNDDSKSLVDIMLMHRTTA